MDSTTIKRRAAVNAFAVLLRGLVQAASIILLTPMLARYLGAHGFGLWSILYAFVPYAAMFDLGVSTALAKHLAEIDYARDRETVSKYVGSATVALIAGMLLLAVLTLAIGRYVPPLVMLRQANLGLCVLLFATALLANLSNYALMGLHRQDLASYIGAAFVIVNSVGTAVVLVYGGKVHALVLFNIALAIATTIICATVFFRISGASLRLRIHSASIKRLLRTGWALQLYGLAALFYLYFGKWIIALEISVAAVATFEIALRVLIVLKQGFSSIASPLMAAASRLSVTSQDAARDLFQNAFRYFCTLTAPAFTAAAVFAPKLVESWMGPGHGESATLLMVLAPGFLLGTLSGVAWFVLVGAAKSSSAIKVALVEVAGGLLLCWVLTRTFGIVGAAAGLTIPGMLSLIGYLYIAQKTLVMNMWARLFDLARALAVSAVIIGPAALLVRAMDSTPLIAMVIGLSIAVTYGALAVFTTSSRERSTILRFLRLQSGVGEPVNA